MKLQKRYTVIKNKDVVRALSADEQEHLATLCEKIQASRKSSLECVVIEADWPEYEPTLASLATRVNRDLEITELRVLVSDLTQRIHTGYDWNADPDNMTLRTGCAINRVTPEEVADSAREHREAAEPSA